MADRTDVVNAISRIYGGKRRVVLSSGAISGHGGASAWGSNGVAPYEGVGGGPVWQARGIVASRLSLPMSQFGANGDGSSAMLQEQSDYRACVDFSAATLIWENLSYLTSDEKGENTYNLKASIFNSSGNYGTISGRQPVTFTGGTESGRRSPNLAPGALVQTPDTGFISTKGTRMVVRHEHTATAAFLKFPTSEVARGLGADGDMVSRKGNALDTGYVDTGDQAGGFYDNTNAPSTYCNGAPSAIIGLPTSRVARIGAIGDSIVDGSGAANNSEATLGFLLTALGNNYPSKRFGNGGYSLQALMADATKRAQRLASAQACGLSHFFVGTFTNDLANGQTTAQIFANLATLQAELNLLPMKPRIVICTAPPRTDAGNATPTASAAERLIFNAAVRAQSIYAYFDIGAWTQASGNNNLWDTTSGRGTADGVHPNDATHTYIASQMTSLLATAFSIAHYP